MISQNITYIYCNFDGFLITLSSFTIDIDIIELTEYIINKYKPLSSLSKYDIFLYSHTINQNDGVVVYVKKSLRRKVKEIKLSWASCLQLDILNNIVLCIYRSPSNNNAESFIDLNLHLDSLNISNKNVIITGDININVTLKELEQLYELKNRTNYLNILSLHGILAGHTISTREKNCHDQVVLKIDEVKSRASVATLRMYNV